MKEAAASPDVEAVLVVDGVEGKDRLVRAAKADARVAAAAHRVGALRLDPTCCQRQAWQGGQVPGQVGRVGPREERLLDRLQLVQGGRNEISLVGRKVFNGGRIVCRS